MNPLAYLRVVSIARHVNERRNEPVEAVPADEDPHLRAFTEPQDPERGVEQLVFADLEELVARKGIENMGQSLAVVTVGRESRPFEHTSYFQSQERNLFRPSTVGAGSEQADKAALASQLSAYVECLHADIVHVDAPVHE